jgi:uncharacterized protein YacL
VVLFPWHHGNPAFPFRRRLSSLVAAETVLITPWPEEIALTTAFDQTLGGANRLLWIVRIVFVIMTVSISGDSVIFALDGKTGGVQFWLGISTAVLALGVSLGVIVLDAQTKAKEITTLSAIYFGLLLGFLIGQLFWAALEHLVQSYLVMAKVEDIRVKYLLQLLITVLSCYVAVATLLQTKDEFRFIIPYVEFSKQLKGAKPLVLDTSVIIDGRIADICDTRIIDSKLIVPRFVLQELQHIADSADKLKRNRGRRGLDILKRMQTNTKIDLEIHEGNLSELRETQKVDEKLVILARTLGARVVTNDFNLNKIAGIQGVDVINLNEVANAVRTVALPGEILTVKLIKPGEQPGQGVGYLEDGTMVVVEQGRSALGQEIGVTVTTVHQSIAGRMIFGKIDGKPA